MVELKLRGARANDLFIPISVEKLEVKTGAEIYSEDSMFSDTIKTKYGHEQLDYFYSDGEESFKLFLKGVGIDMPIPGSISKKSIGKLARKMLSEGKFSAVDRTKLSFTASANLDVIMGGSAVGTHWSSIVGNRRYCCFRDTDTVIRKELTNRKTFTIDTFSDAHKLAGCGRKIDDYIVRVVPVGADVKIYLLDIKVHKMILVESKTTL